MNRDRQLVPVAEHHGGDEVLVEGVHAAGPDQSHQVQRAVPSLHYLAELHEGGQAEELARLDRLGNAHHVLRHHAARAQVQVADFAVADLSLGEADL